MSKSRRAKLILMTDGSSKMRTLRLSRLRILLTTAVLVTIVGIVTYTAGRFLAVRYINVAMSDVLEENQDLHEQLSSMGQRLEEVDHQLSELAQSDDQLRIMADIPKIDKDVRQVGVGGIPLPGIDFNDEDEQVRKLIFDLDKLEREIRLQQQSFLEIRRQFAEKEELLRHTPSIRPVEGGYISSHFGRRRDPFTHQWTHHNGTDFSLERGAPVFSTADGRVVCAKRMHGLGNVVVIDHGYGYTTVYAHLDMFNVTKKQQVARGQKIGEVGNTGRSTAPHLHYEVHVDGKAVNAIDYFFEGYADLSKL